MSETRWTPGPLAVSRDAVPEWHEQFTVYAESDGKRVATVFGEADAHLFAVAARLYEALDALLHYAETPGDFTDEEGRDTMLDAGAALAKARGEKA